MKFFRIVILGLLSTLSNAAFAQPDAVTTDGVSSITPTTANVQGTIDLGLFQSSADYFFKYGTASDLTGANVTSTLTANGSFNAVLNVDRDLTALNAETQYYYQLSATAGGGTATGTIENFRTLSNVFTSALADFKVQSNSTTSIHLEWTAAAPSSVADGYLMIYQTGAVAPDPSSLQQGVNPAGQTVAGATILDVSGGSTNNVDITGLTASTQYSFIIIPYNSDGSNDETYHYNKTTYSNLSAFTLYPEPSDNAGAASFVSSTPSSITLSFAKSDGAVPADGYFISYRASASNPNNPSAGIDGTAGTSQLVAANTDGIFTLFSTDATITAEIPGLNPKTVYSFRILAFSSEPGKDSTSFNYKTNGITFNNEFTLATEPTSSIATLEKTGASTSQIDFSFDPYSFADNGGFVLYYQAGSSAPDVSGVTDGINPDNQTTAPSLYSWEPTDAATTISTSGSITAGTQYSFALVLYNSDGTNDGTINYKISSPETITVWSRASNPSGAVANLIADGATANSFDVSYDAVTADGYLAVYGTTAFDVTEIVDQVAPISQTVANGTIVDLGSVSSATISSLLANTAYEVSIIPYNVALDSGNPVADTYNYRTGGALTANISTICAAPSNQAAFSTTAKTATTIDLNWNTVADADRYLILASEGTDPDFIPVNGEAYTGNTDYSAALTEGTNSKVVFSGAYPALPLSITQLDPSTEYRFFIYAFNVTDNCYNTNTPGSVTLTTNAPSNNNTLAILTEATTINAISNDINGSFITAMSFSMTDEGVDIEDTHLSSFIITAGASDDFAANGIDWTDIIAAAQIVNTTTTGNETFPVAISPTGNSLSLTIPNTENDVADEFGFIAEGNSITLELQIKLKDNISSTQIDNKNFSFQLDPANITVEGPSSGFDTAGGTTITSDPSKNEIAVTASKFTFTTQPPAAINAGEDMTPQPVFEARDANNNIDLDFSTAFTVTNTDNIPMNNAPTAGFTNGVHTFPVNFNYQGSGQGQLTITSGALTGTSNAVAVTPTVSYLTLASGLNAGELDGGSSDQAIIGVAITALGSTNLNEIVLHQDLTIASKIENVRLYLSANNTFEGIGTETEIAATVTIDNGAAKTITFNSFTESINTTTKYYFVVVDVNDQVNEFDTPALTLSFDQTDFNFTSAVNKLTYADSETYTFNDIIAPEVTSISSAYSVISDSDAGNTFTLSITFNEEMDNTLNPSISFPAEAPGTTLTINNVSSNWSAGNTVFNAVYDLADININVADIDVKAEGARDKSLNTQMANTIVNVFSVDTQNPTVSISLNNSLINVASLSTTLTATFSEAMNPAQLPTFTISGTTNMSLNGAGVWSSANTVFTQTFTHDGTSEEVTTNSIQLSVATDVYGNVMVPNSSPNYVVDTQPAEITDISASSADGLYGPGDLVVIIVAFDDNVVVSGNPKLILNATGAEAVFAGVSANKITFNYTVGSVGSGQNVLDLNVNSLSLNGGTIKDANTNNVNTTIPGSPNNLADNAAIAIDTKAAVVTNVTSVTADGFYKAGEVIQLLVTFDEAVTASGNPTLSLTLDNAATATATYVSAQSATALIFEYTVAATENTADLAYTNTNALDLAGGSILDAADIASVLTLPVVGSINSLSGSSEIVIDTEAPLLTSDAFKPANDSLNVSHTNSFKIEFNEEVLGAGNNNVRLVRFSDNLVITAFDADTLFNNSEAITLLTQSLAPYISDTTVYYFEFDAGAIVDKAGNSFAGFSGNTFWKFTSAGPARIDSYSEGACVGEEFIIKGEYFTGVTLIEIGGGAVTYDQNDLTITENGDSILFLVKANTESGLIKLIKESGKSNNTEEFSSTSAGDIFVGPSSAQIAITPLDICNDGDGGAADAIQFSINVVGGSGTYTIVYNNGVENINIAGYDNGTDIELIPPQIGTNTYSLVSVVDNDAILSSCGVPGSALGTNVEVEKYARSIVEAGGGTLDTETGYGVITVCIAETDNVDLSDITQAGVLPEITGNVTSGMWGIIGGGTSSGGFNASKTNKTSNQTQPTYYFSLDDVARGEVVLELTSDDPGGNNPCIAASDRLIVRFVSSSQANPTSASMDVCSELIDGSEAAIAQVTAVKGGGATDIEWTRDNGANTDTFDGSWGFADSATATSFTLSSTNLKPYYKASPSELGTGFAKLFVKATAGNCGTSLADSVPLSVNIRPLLAPTFSSQAGVNPSEVCAGAESVTFKVNASSPNTSFVWNVSNSGVDALNQNDKNEIATASVDGAYGNSITINFREVSTDATDTITVYEQKNGCFSEILSFNVEIKASPIAQITAKPSSTINNSTTNFILSGRGIYDNDTIVGGAFTGKGVVLKSDGTYVLNTTTLSPTSVADSTDDYQIIYTFTTTLGCSATDTAKFDVFDQENSFPQLEAIYCEDEPAFEITLDNAVLGQGFEVIDIYGPGNSDGVEFISSDTATIYKALIDPVLLLADNQGNINITITYATRNSSNGDINLEAGSQSVIVNPLPQTAVEQLNASYCTSDGIINLRRDETVNPNNSFHFSVINSELPNDLGLLRESSNPKSFQLDLGVLPPYFQSTGNDSLHLKLRYTYTSDAGCLNADTISTVIYKLPEQAVIISNRLDYTFTVSGGTISKRDTVEIANNTGLVTYWFAESGAFTIGDELATGDKFSPNIDLNSTQEDYFAVRYDKGCFSQVQEVVFYRQEPPSFTWNSSVFDTDSPIIFSASDNNESNLGIQIVARHWEIVNQQGIPLTIDDQQQGLMELTYFFTEAGEYTITYSATTNRGSIITSSNNVVVVPKVETLFDNFNGSINSWVSTGSNSSWEKAIPSEESDFSNEDALWITNSEGDYNGQEKSFLYSPAFNIQNIDKPVVSFNLWLDMTNGDGVRLEYSTDDKLIGASSKEWIPLGIEGSGLDWYNSNDLGVEDIGFATGWTGNFAAGIDNAYNARHDLSAIQAQENGGSTVIFRYNFSSNSFNTKNGVAIDNFSIESLNRTRLIEYFGSFSTTDYNQMQVVKDDYLNNDDIAFLNYRINEADPYFSQAVSDVTTRMNFYEAFEANNDFVLDGNYFEQALISSSTSSAQISNRVLVSSSYALKVSQEIIDNQLTIEVDVSTVGNLTIPEGLHLMVAVVNSEVAVSNDTILYNVLAAFLPSAQGIVINEEGKYTFNYTPTSTVGAQNLKTIAFLQQFNADDTKEVYQAAISDNTLDLDYLVTSASSVSFGEIKVFPNPANDFINISMNGAKTAVIIKLFDMYGRQVEAQVMNTGVGQIELSTNKLATGMYQLCISDKAGNITNLKVAVKH